MRAIRALQANLERPVEAPTAEIDRFFGLSLDMLCIAGMDGHFKRVSSAFTETLGWTAKELLARPILEFIHPDDHAATLAGMARLIQGVPLVQLENRYECRDGSWRWLSWKAQPDLKARLLYGTARDVTQQRQTAEALRSSSARYQSLFSAIDQGFCIVEMVFDERDTPLDYRFLEVNPSFQKQTGLSDAVGKSMREIAPDHEAHWFDIYGRVALTGEAIRFQNRAEALHRWYDVYAFRVGEPKNRHVGILFDDISLRRRSEETVAQLNADLQIGAAHLAEANKELEAFSYSVSHDLRAPLRHIHGYVDMLQRAMAGQLSPTADRYLQTIRAASVEMAQLIDALLAFSRMARAEMRQSEVDLDPMVQDAVGRAAATGAGRNIDWRIAPLPRVLGDPALLKQVVANLVDNAVKYSRGRDMARIEVGHAGAEDGRAVLFVRDNGAGFDMQYAHKLFGVFQRLHRADEFEGTGIGLATVQRIISRHGGRVWAEAALDHGATFYFTLKLVACPG